MDGFQNIKYELFASANFLDNDAGAGGEKRVENDPEYRNIDLMINNLLDATTNIIEDTISDNSIITHKQALIKLLCMENLNLFEPFLKPFEEQDSYNKIMKISDTLSNELFNPYTKGVFDFLNLDISGTYENFEDEIGIPFEKFNVILDNLNVCYRESLIRLFRADRNLRDSIKNIENLFEQVNVILNLENNDTTKDLLISTAKYVHTTVQNVKLYDLFNEFISARKAFISYRQLIQSKNVINSIEASPTCSICMVGTIKQIAIPCGHTFCDPCMLKQYSCYICRTKIDKKNRIFFN